MICFIVATPLQLFNSIMIMRHHFVNDRMDIFALNITCDMHSVLEDYKSLEVINKIYFFDDLCCRQDKIGIVKDYIFTSKENRLNLHSIEKSGYSYTDMFTTWVGGPGTWLYTKISKYYPNIKLHFYEEGLGVYYRKLYSSGFNGIKKLYKVLGYKFEGDFLEDIYVFQPDIYHGSQISTVQIGPVTQNDIDYLRNKSERKQVYYPQRIVFFENAYENTYLEGMDERIIIDKLCEAIGKDNIVVRLHPISKIDKYKDCDYIFDSYNSVPWEDLLPDISNLNDLIFVSDLSTAIFSPKLLYDLEPTIIITGKAIAMENKGKHWASSFWSDGFSQFSYDIKKLYQRPERVIIPENYSDLVKCLKELQ